jgi:pimeloyl-ACP methyl ester carboxylesterase
MTMQTGDIGQLRQDAVEKIIFHATPKKWLREALIFAGRHLLNGWTVMDRLSEIKVPTLVMAGRDDFLFPPEHQVELAAGIPNARLRIIERAGHNVLSERPAEVMEAVRDFISAGAGVLPTAGSPVPG